MFLLKKCLDLRDKAARTRAHRLREIRSFRPRRFYGRKQNKLVAKLSAKSFEVDVVMTAIRNALFAKFVLNIPANHLHQFVEPTHEAF